MLVNHWKFLSLVGAVAGLISPPALATEAPPQVTINEIHFAPEPKTEAVEFIELHNPSGAVISLAGWSLTGGVGFSFPPEASIPAGGFLVVGENPAALKVKFGATALGPWTGRLSNRGDTLRLRNGAGEVVDEVDYQLGFPWPTVGDPPGYSIELIHPSLDNSLGGSWRASVAGGVSAASQSLVTQGSTWRYRKGTEEASNPTTAWRQRDFNDASWESGATPVGYDPSFGIATPLADMNDNFTTVFLRKKFTVSNPAEITSLTLEAVYDDGFKVWINGRNVLNRNVAAGEVAFDGLSLSTRESADWETNILPSPAGYLVAGENIIAVQLHNTLLSGSSDCFLDLRLLANVGPSTRGPTPGAVNSVFSTNAPPQVRQVTHSPEQPASNQPVRITAKVTDPDGVKSVVLEFQLVDPGNYIELADAAFRTSWSSVPMNDSGRDGDELAGDGIFSAELPASLQVHRRLVRYRLTATDQGNRAVTAPFPDDPQPNFAYFVYDGVPEWRGAIRPGSADPKLGTIVTYGTNLMRRFPVYHLISKKSSVETATWRERYGGDLYKWKGTLVYEGKVYDHIGYRARGGVWRYAMGKNMWKFDFNRGHDFEPRDNYGRKYKAAWTKLNLGACIQQGDYGHRGEQGMFESVGFALFNLAGVESPKTHFVQFRVIDDAAETNPASQFEGDFWGLYLAIEQEDGRFLDEHDLPDGNLYKMEGGTGTLNNQGATAAADRSDLDSFINLYRASSAPSDLWWRTNMDLPRYYSYRAIVEAIHHYDIDEAAGKNYFYYLNPVTGRWSTHAWDLDLTWADSMYGGGNEPFKNRVLANARVNFRIEYANRLRELRDLLFNSEQAFQLIDEFAAMLRDPAGGPSFLDVDRAMWDFNPVMTNTAIINPSKAGHGRFYQAATTKDFNGMVAKMKTYVNFRGTQILDKLAADAAIPLTPTVTFTGEASFPANKLSFRASDYAGANDFAAIKWRLAEVTPSNRAPFDPAAPRRYEIEADWESVETSSAAKILNLPPNLAKPGRTYRVRAQHRDATGRASRWSQPVEFVASEPDTLSALVENLRLTELMYDPAAGSDFEFVELHNRGTALLDLSNAKFTAGIDFTFSAGTSLAPSGYLVVTRATNAQNFATFRAAYGIDATVPVFGPFTGRLDNNGETLTIKAGVGGIEVVSFRFENGLQGWPALPDASNLSIQLTQPAALASAGTNWIAAAPTPGRGFSAPLDSDNDGLPDAWETSHGFDPRSNADALLDSDGDRLTNLQEFLAGTDPRSASSHLGFDSARVAGGNLLLGFQASAGRAYVIEVNDSLPGAWQAAATIPAENQPRLVTVPLALNPSRPARFYRLRVQ